MSVEDFLQQQAQVGSLDGQGQFTLDPETAWQKLGSFQLGDPNAWVRKIVQAAVADSAIAVEVRQGRNSTKIAIDGVPHWNLHDLLAAVFELKALGGTAMAQLATAIRVLVSQSQRAVKIRFPDGQVAEWNGRLFEDKSRSNPGQRFELEIVHHPEAGVTGLAGYFAALTYSVDLSQQFDRYCYPSPVPISLDGRRIEPPAQQLATLDLDPEASGVGTLGCLKSHWWHLENKQWQGPEAFFEVRLTGPLTKKSQLGKLVLDYKLTTGLSIAGHRWESLQARPASLCWLRHGVIVEREELEGRSVLGMDVFLDAKDLKTDLSGLQLVKDRQQAAARKLGLATASRLLNLCELEFSRRFEAPDPWAWLKVRREYSSPLVAFIIRTLYALLLVVAFPLVILVVAGMSVQSLWDSGRKKLPESGLNQQQKAVETALATLQDAVS